jgi:hypothetical protein
LAERLMDNSSPCRATAAGMLGSFADDAKPAVPQLVQALKDVSQDHSVEDCGSRL